MLLAVDGCCGLRLGKWEKNSRVECPVNGNDANEDLVMFSNLILNVSARVRVSARLFYNFSVFYFSPSGAWTRGSDLGCCFSGSFLVIFRYIVREIKSGREEILSSGLLGVINCSEKKKSKKFVKIIKVGSRGGGIAFVLLIQLKIKKKKNLKHRCYTYLRWLRMSLFTTPNLIFPLHLVVKLIHCIL